MTYGSPLRPPPRRRRSRRFRGGRLTTFSCIALTAFTLGTGRAEAYPCGDPQPARSLSVAVAEECPRPGTAKREKRAETDVVSLALFIAMLGVVLLIPIEYSRRRLGDPE